MEPFGEKRRELVVAGDGWAETAVGESKFGVNISVKNNGNNVFPVAWFRIETLSVRLD